MHSVGLKSPVIGNYRLDEVIGRGGMGVVFRAQQEHLKRSVAMKIIPADSEEKSRRFEVEINQLSRLSHPNIVRAFDAGRSGGITYLAMELVEGETLDSRVQRRGPLKPQQAIAIVRQTAEALAYSHQHGIIHRDVKPANLMLDSTGTVKLLDLGMLRMIQESIVDADSPTRVELSRTGVLLGTPEFMAPEQAEDPSSADERSDIYALGGTFYFLLTGKRMFESSGRLDAVLSRQDGEPPHLGSQLDEIFQRMVEREPTDRHPSMEAVIQDLDSISTPRSKRKLVVALSAGLLLLVATYFAVQSGGANLLHVNNQTPTEQPSPETDRAEHPHKTLENALVGTTWQLTYPSTFVFHEEGVAHPVEKPYDLWIWAAVSPTEVVIRYPTGWINVIEFDKSFKTCRLHEIGVPKNLGNKAQHRHTGKVVD